ncbi:hypothetical protein NST11_03960 [Caldifermentibacillus hisashii]|uniref:hypothetical protein n=1 Tax=Caldifermentibacillus hisashii TaxID=996558 RepID=UPI0031B7D53C
MATKPNLVTVLRRKMHYFGDETHSRHRFWSKISYFWRRNLISSSFLVENLSILATKPNLVTVLRREMLYFDDETHSRHHFEVRNIIFWRRESRSHYHSHPYNFQAHHRGRKWFLHGRNQMDMKEQNKDIGRSDSKVRKELITKGLTRPWK